jgi:hypothetical protein
MLFFGISFSRNEQMTEVSWTRRWDSFVSSHNCGPQFDFTVEDAREFSRFIQLRAREGLDCPTVASEYHSLVKLIFPTNPILKALMTQSAYKGMTVPMIIVSTISAYPNFGWMNLFASNPTMSEVTLLMKYLRLMEGDVYAGFPYAGIATSVRNLAYLCVKMQAEVGGDEQMKKYNGIGGLKNTTLIP